MSGSSAGVVSYSHVYVASARGPDRSAGVLVQDEAAELAADGHPAAIAEKELVAKALAEAGWQKTRAAALLGITRATLYAKVKHYNIQAPAKTPVMAT